MRKGGGVEKEGWLAGRGCAGRCCYGEGGGVGLLYHGCAFLVCYSTAFRFLFNGF